MLKAFQIQFITNNRTKSIISDATFTMYKCNTHDAAIVVVVFSFQQILPCYMRRKFEIIDEFWMDIACAVAFWGHLKTKNYFWFFLLFWLILQNKIVAEKEQSDKSRKFKIKLKK